MQFQIGSSSGVGVFGSSIIRVAPDIASLTFSTSHLADHPRDAIHKVKEDAQKIRDYIATVNVTVMNTSRVSLKEEHHLKDGNHNFIGFRASISFQVITQQLDQVEDILIGLVDTGVNRISKVSYETTNLKAFRAEARKRAVRAAIEKAQLYCSEAGVTLGDALNIEDIDPDQVRGSSGHNISREMMVEDEDLSKGYTPESIVIKGAVKIRFAIEQT